MVSAQRELAGETDLLLLFVTGNHPTSPAQLSLFTIQTPDLPGATQLFSSQLFLCHIPAPGESVAITKDGLYDVTSAQTEFERCPQQV